MKASLSTPFDILISLPTKSFNLSKQGTSALYLFPTGSTQVDADSAISELVFYKKLYIEIEYATPPNIKANFYKEVSIKRR